MLTHKGTQVLNTERLLLRRIEPDDADDVFAWMSDAEVCRYERWLPHTNKTYSRGYILAVFGDYHSATTYKWGIELDGRLIGSISVVDVDEHDQKAVLGYCLAREFWSRGFATEAAAAVLHFMFINININRIEASHSVNNVASGRVLEKLGMNFEGLAHDYYYCSAGFQDSRLFGLTRTQYLQENGANSTHKAL